MINPNSRVKGNQDSQTGKSKVKKRKKVFIPEPPKESSGLKKRQSEFLVWLHEMGGMVRTVDCAMRWYPPQLDHRLRIWGLSKEEVQQALTDYPPRQIDQVTQLLSWAYQQDADLRPTLDWWLQSLPDRKDKPEVTALILETLKMDRDLPQAFLDRPKHPSQFTSSLCTDDLREMFDEGWIVFDQIKTNSASGAGQRLIYLTAKSKTYVSGLLKVPVKEVNYKKKGTYNNDQHLAHRLLLNEIANSFEAAAKHKGWVIRKSLNENEMERLQSKQEIFVNDEETTVQSDGYIWLDTGLPQGNWFFLIEADRGSESLLRSKPDHNLETIALKVQKYGEWYKEYFEQTFPESWGKGRIIFLTSGGKRRVQNMSEVIRQVAGVSGAGKYWLATYETLRPVYFDYFNTALVDAYEWTQASKPGEKKKLIWENEDHNTNR